MLERALVQAFRKTALGQVTVFPAYITLFFGYMRCLEGGTPQQAVERVQEKFWPTAVAGTVFWPVANMFNFTCVPANQRVLYVGVVGLLWNAYLSWKNSQGPTLAKSAF